LIKLHKLNGSPIVLNAELIEALEPGAETSVVLATGNRYLVRESAEEITAQVVEYRKKVASEGKVVNPIKGYIREQP